MATFVINNRKYVSKPVTFNTVCDFEEMGLSFSEIEKKTTSFLRGYLSICGHMSIEQAGKEIEQHLINGGDFEEMATVMMNEVANSDFFQALNKKQEQEITEIPTAEKKRK